jgi:hypothetical protein
MTAIAGEKNSGVFDEKNINDNDKTRSMLPDFKDKY